MESLLKNKKKIAVATSGNIPSQWANSINTVKHSNGFKNLGYDVEVISSLRYFENKKLKEINSNIQNFYDVDKNIKFILFKDLFFYFKDIKYFKFLFNIFEFIKRYFNFDFYDVENKITKYIIKNDFDLVYSRNFKIAIKLKNTGIPVIIETHTSNENNFYLRKLARNFDEKYFYISTISQILKEKYVGLGIPPENIIVQEDAVDLEKFDKILKNKKELRTELNLNIDKKKTLVTYCGSLRPGKGINSLINLAKLFRNEKTVFLIIGGPERIKKKLKKQCEKNNLNNIIFLGFISNDLIPKYLKASDILIMLYSKLEKKTIMDLNTTSPIKLFEYMAAKKPIVVTEVPTISKIVCEEEVLFTKIDNLDNIVEKMKKLLNDKQLQSVLSENSYNLSKKYTYKIRCEKIIKSIKNEKFEKNN